MKPRLYKFKVPASSVPLNNQSILVAEVLLRHQDTGCTTAAIAEEIKDVLRSRQTPERVVAFYICSWKKRGYLEALVPVPDESSKPTKEPPAIVYVPRTPKTFEDVPLATSVRRHVDNLLCVDPWACDLADAVLYLLAEDYVKTPEYEPEPDGLSIQDMKDALEDDYARCCTAAEISSAVHGFLATGIVKKLGSGIFTIA
jgi:hypothetical protein